MLITIDERSCKVKAGQTILEAARENGIDIPALCSDQKLVAFGGCRLCCVEVLEYCSGGCLDEPDLVSACTTKVDALASVRTSSERISAVRRTVLSLLRHRAGDSDVLDELIGEYGIDEDIMRVLGDMSCGQGENHQGFLADCILCGQCIRACMRRGKRALILEGSGGAAHVAKPLFGGQSACDDCGLCQRVCPTGAIAHIVPEKIGFSASQSDKG